MGALHDIGRTLGLAVRPYTATARAPFESYLSVMARTGVLVSRHGPLLANSIFLPPGYHQSSFCHLLPQAVMIVALPLPETAPLKGCMLVT